MLLLWVGVDGSVGSNLKMTSLPEPEPWVGPLFEPPKKDQNANDVRPNAIPLHNLDLNVYF